MSKIEVNSENIEFGYELISCIPYAYYLHQNNLLKKTISGADTQCLYFFSEVSHQLNPFWVGFVIEYDCFVDNISRPVHNVTHWIPLPNPPEK